MVPVGPSGLYLYLHTVGHALRGMHVAESALELADTLQRARDEVTALLDADARMESQLLQLGRGHATARNAAAQPRPWPWSGSPAQATTTGRAPDLDRLTGRTGHRSRPRSVRTR